MFDLSVFAFDIACLIADERTLDMYLLYLQKCYILYNYIRPERIDSIHMGGQAIKNSRRMSREEYEYICKDLISKHPNMMITYSYKEKDSYGDIDAVVLGEIPELPNISERVINGACTSICLDGHQVDFFPVKTVDEQEHLHAYLSYSIFGMCVGICLNKLGLQYGIDGLKIKVAEGRYMLLSNISKDIFKFLKLDLDRFHQGFKDESELFDYIFTSPYVCYEALLKQSLKVGSRLQPLQQYTSKQMQIHTHAPQLEDVLETFEKQEEYASILMSIEKQKYLQSKFNGKIVMEVLGNKLQGKELGSFISEFKRTHDIENMNDDDIKQEIIHCFPHENRFIAGG